MEQRLLSAAHRHEIAEPEVRTRSGRRVLAGIVAMVEGWTRAGVTIRATDDTVSFEGPIHPDARAVLADCPGDVAAVLDDVLYRASFDAARARIQEASPADDLRGPA